MQLTFSDQVALMAHRPRALCEFRFAEEADILQLVEMDFWRRITASEETSKADNVDQYDRGNITEHGAWELPGSSC